MARLSIAVSQISFQSASIMPLRFPIHENAAFCTHEKLAIDERRLAGYLCPTRTRPEKHQKLLTVARSLLEAAEAHCAFWSHRPVRACRGWSESGQLLIRAHCNLTIVLPMRNISIISSTAIRTFLCSLLPFRISIMPNLQSLEHVMPPLRCFHPSLHQVHDPAVTVPPGCSPPRRSGDSEQGCCGISQGLDKTYQGRGS